MEVALKLLGILFSVLARTLVPYLRKLKQGKIKSFNKGYWASASSWHEYVSEDLK